MSRWLGLIAVLLACSPLTRPAWAQSYQPQSDDEVVARLPQLPQLPWSEARASTDLAITTGAGDDALLAQSLQLVENGRKRSDPWLVDRAQTLLESHWPVPADRPPRVGLLLAVIAQHRHEFARARHLLDAVIARSPRLTDAWLTRAMLYAAGAEPMAAHRDCITVERLRPDLLSASCLAHVQGLIGQGERAHARLSQLLASTPDAPPSQRAHALDTLAELALRAGRAELARTHLQDALQLDPESIQRLQRLLDVLLVLDRPREVEAMLTRVPLVSGRRAPGNAAQASETRLSSGLLLRRALARQQLRDPRAATDVRELDERLRLLSRAGERSHLSDLARVALYLHDDPVSALRHARAAWAVQRTPEDALLLLSAAQAAADPGARAEVLRWMQATGIADARLNAHLHHARRAPGLAHERSTVSNR
ncbi:MAG: hypothetical protein KDK91_02240 [Gammaproteobacteria bacterium]|nr:hypothetical protein [Gammaproteobacteria bacterium]